MTTAEELETPQGEPITTDDFLDAVARAEQAEADHAATKQQLSDARYDLRTTRSDRDSLASKLEGIRVLHDHWGDQDVHGLDPTVMWEALADVLGEAP